MCTVAVWKNNDIANVAGRTLDWHEDMHSNLWVLPAGQERIGLVNDANSLNWQSKYASIATSGYDIATCDGVNEKSLGMHMLWLAESDYGLRNTNAPGLSISLWGQYYLDNFATVQEAVDHTKQHPFDVVTTIIGDTPVQATVHLALEDNEGDMAIFEFIDGKLSIHHSKKYDVMTNSPNFELQLQNLSNYQGYGGNAPLPGTTAAADRFVRAAYYLKHLNNKPNDLRQTLAGVMSVIRNTSQPFGTDDPDRPNISPTLWRTMIDHKNLSYYFESTLSPYLIWADLQAFDLSTGASTMLYDIAKNDNAYGDVSKLFKPANLFEWAMPKSISF